MHSKHKSSILSVPAAPTPKSFKESKGELKLETEEEIAKLGLLGPPVLQRQQAVRNFRGSKRRAVKALRSKRALQAPLFPPEIVDVSMTSQVLRFAVTNGVGGTVSVTYATMLGAMGVMGKVTNSSVASIHSTFKINKVLVWPAVNSAAGATPLPEIEFLGGGTTEVARDYSLNRSLPAGVTQEAKPVVGQPLRKTLAGDWIYPAASSSQVIMKFYNLTQGAIIDVHVSGTLRNNLSGIDLTVTTAVVGNLYWLYLDGPVTGYLQPVGRPPTL